MRRAVVSVLALAPFAAGCFRGELFHTANGLTSKTIDTPAVREASEATAARVYQVGRQVMAANLFTGIDPSFQTLGHPEPMIFHRDLYGVFITDSLADRCKTDTELAAVLCSELGKMVAERRNAARMGFSEPLPNIDVANSGEAGGIPADQVRLAELGMLEKKSPKAEADRLRNQMTDPQRIAAELMKTAGFDAKELDAVAPLLRSANKDRQLLKQLGGPAAAPKWSN